MQTRQGLFVAFKFARRFIHFKKIFSVYFIFLTRAVMYISLKNNNSPTGLQSLAISIKYTIHLNGFN